MQSSSDIIDTFIRSIDLTVFNTIRPTKVISNDEINMICTEVNRRITSHINTLNSDLLKIIELEHEQVLIQERILRAKELYDKRMINTHSLTPTIVKLATPPTLSSSSDVKVAKTIPSTPIWNKQQVPKIKEYKLLINPKWMINREQISITDGGSIIVRIKCFDNQVLERKFSLKHLLAECSYSSTFKSKPCMNEKQHTADICHFSHTNINGKTSTGVIIPINTIRFVGDKEILPYTLKDVAQAYIFYNGNRIFSSELTKKAIDEKEIKSVRIGKNFAIDIACKYIAALYVYNANNDCEGYKILKRFETFQLLKKKFDKEKQKCEVNYYEQYDTIHRTETPKKQLTDVIDIALDKSKTKKKTHSKITKKKQLTRGDKWSDHASSGDDEE